MRLSGVAWVDRPERCLRECHKRRPLVDHGKSCAVLFTGGGGAGGGSSSLDSLMDQMPFGPRPKVVDLTSDANRLASKLQEAVLKCDERHRDELLYYLLVRPHPPSIISLLSCFLGF